MIDAMLKESRFDFMSEKDKDFVAQMTAALLELGYTFGDTITDGICWGKYMLIFRKQNVKSKKVYARIYIKDDSVAFRLFLSDITKHSAFVSAAPAHIKSVFAGASGACGHCRGDECRFRKSFELDGKLIEKCNGEVFTFEGASSDKIPDYLALLCEFYGKGKHTAKKVESFS